MNKIISNKEELTNNKKILHHEALKSLCALQYYMSTLESQSEDLKKTNYGLSFKLMKNIVDTLYNTIENQTDNIDYPIELVMIYNNINNINKKLEFLKK